MADRAMPSFSKSPPELVERFATVLAGYPDAKQKPMFGFPAAFVGGNMATSLFRDRWVVRLPEPEIEAAKAAGARFAGYVLLRLPGSVKEVFETRVRAALPLRAEKILHRIRETRGGKLYDSRFGVRGKGEGVYAEQARLLFDTTCRRLGLDRHDHEEDEDEPERSTFVRPPRSGDQLKLL